MWILYLCLILQVIFGIHAIKTGRSFAWVLILILFSVVGVGAYIILELLPEWYASPKGNKFKKAVGKKIDPEKNLKAALTACQQLDSAQNRINLAEQYMLLKRYAEARDVYQRTMTGVYAEDPQIILGLAKAEFGVNNAEKTITLLETIKALHPKLNNPEANLLYARALENAGRITDAIAAYERLSDNYPTPEPACRLAQLYKTQGNMALAMELFQAVVKRSMTAGELFNEVNQDWVRLAKQELSYK
jgi:hypothetical protein